MTVRPLSLSSLYLAVFFVLGCVLAIQTPEALLVGSYAVLIGCRLYGTLTSERVWFGLVFAHLFFASLLLL